MTGLDALTAACLEGPDNEARLPALSDWLEERGDGRAAAVRRVPLRRAAVAAARPEEIPNDSEGLVAAVPGQVVSSSAGPGPGRVERCGHCDHCRRWALHGGTRAGAQPETGPAEKTGW